MWKRKRKCRARTVKSKSSFRGVLSSRLISFLLPLLFLLTVFAPCVQPSAAATPPPQKLKPNDRYALIFGTVWGPDDRAVYGIRVSIHRLPGKKPKWDLVSDHAGEFAQRVPVGEADYLVSADLKGVKTADGQPLHLVQPVTVHVEYDERIDMSLHLTR
jgi:hypothetical protein